MRREWQRLGAALTIATLAACRTAPVPSPTGAGWEVRRPELQARNHFELKGRVAVAAGNEGFNANLHWTQDGERSFVTLEGPLGVGGAQVTASGPQLSLVTSRGEHVDSDAAHAALEARLGFDPPLSSLRYWVLGVPDPGSPFTEALDAQSQRLSGLTQSGWRIDYTAYAAVGAQSLPSRLTLQRDAVRVRLLVDDWQL
jgi:outer membrane lipoprotein LolB